VELKYQGASHQQIADAVGYSKSRIDHLLANDGGLRLTLADYDKSSAVYKANDKRITELAEQQADYEDHIAKLEAKIVDPRQIKLSKSEFLNVVKTAADKMRAGSAVEKDVLCRILFLNLRVNNEKVVDFIWKEPFASLVKSVELSYGRGDRI
jgi:hypothetical protein